MKNAHKETLLIINKIDLPLRIDTDELRETFPHLSPIETSAIKGSGLDTLKRNVAGLILAKVTPSSNDMMINLRQKRCLEEVKECLWRTKDGLKNGLSEEFLALELREGIEHLDQLTGQKLGEEVLHRIFSNFCIGK